MTRHSIKCAHTGCLFTVTDSARSVVDAAWDKHETVTGHLYYASTHYQWSEE